MRTRELQVLFGKGEPMKAILMPIKGKAAIEFDKILASSKRSKPEPITKEQREEFMQFMKKKWAQER